MLFHPPQTVRQEAVVVQTEGTTLLDGRDGAAVDDEEQEPVHISEDRPGSIVCVFDPQQAIQFAGFSEVVYVFGSNSEGRHGKGDALLAARCFGARYGVAKGRTGKSYAVMVKHLSVGKRSVPIQEISRQTRKLLGYAERWPKLLFVIARIGCVNGGYEIHEIASLFRPWVLPPNVILNTAFGQYWKGRAAVRLVDVLGDAVARESGSALKEGSTPTQ